MLDVLHYLFEEDLAVATSEELDARNKVRKTVYREIYNKEYTFGITNSSSGNNYDYGLDDLDGPVNAPATNKTKPYFPPTPFNPDAADPFGGALREKPLG